MTVASSTSTRTITIPVGTINAAPCEVPSDDGTLVVRYLVMAIAVKRAGRRGVLHIPFPQPYLRQIVSARAAADDRVPIDEFMMTHQFLALMLGVRRQTVSAVASDLSRRGLIVYRRGWIEIVDRVGLEGATCECYDVIRDEFARLVGPPIPRARKAWAAVKSP